MGWIEVRGLPFYLLFEKYLFHLADGWGKVIKIDKRVAKLVDLSKILLKVEVKEIGFLLASITITSEGVDNQTGIIEMNEGRILISGGRGSHERLEAMCK